MVELANPPAFAKKSRSAAAKRGYAYEAKVGKHLATLAAGVGWELWTQQWLFHKGKFCCPDFVLISPGGCAVVVEVKLTYVDTSCQRFAYEQLLELLGYRVSSITVCKNLHPDVDTSAVVYSFEDCFPDSVVHLWL